MAEPGPTEAKPSFPTMDLYVARSAPDQKHKNTAVARVTTLKVLDEKKGPLTGEKYAIYQGKKKDEGMLADGGLATFYTVDPAEPFRFEVTGRACLIRKGAYLVDTGKEETEYGGTLVDWTLAEASVDGDADTKFWSHYDRVVENDEKESGRPRVMTLWQHDHITRRDIAIRPSFTVEKAEIQARPIRIRVGPLVRYTDHESATFWFELETPAVVKVTCGKAKSQDVDPRKSGGADVESLEGVRKGYASTVRVGGRYYALVEVKGLSPGTLYDYQPALTSPPAMGDIPAERELERLFSTPPSDAVKKDIEEQIKARSYYEKTQFSFRTLMRSYDKDVEFVYGSCRKWAYDKQNAKADPQYDALEAYAYKLIGGQPFHGDFPKFMFLGGERQG